MAMESLTGEESAKLVDIEKVSREAIDRVEQTGIIFLDEIDKVAGRESGKGGPDVSREGVQRDLLPIIEGSQVNTKHGIVRTDHILFIAAGAFHRVPVLLGSNQDEGTLFLSANYYLWCGMARSDGAERYNRYIKYLAIVIVAAFLVWFTPHTLVLTNEELKALGGPYHKYLGPLGIMPAKNSA